MDRIELINAPRCATLENKGSCILLMATKKPLQSPTDPKVFLDDRIGDTSNSACFAKKGCSITDRKKSYVIHRFHPTLHWQLIRA